MSEAGERNKGDLLEELAEAVYDRDCHRTNLMWIEANSMEKRYYKADMATAIGVLIRKGYLTEDGIIAAKAIDDGA